MKQIYLSLLILIPIAKLFAQENIGIGTQTPHASAILDVSSTTKGLLAPRMTTAQRSAIDAPAKGLLVYDTDANSLYHYNGSAWTNLAGGGGGGFSLPYAANVNLNSPAFQIENSGAGDILFLGASNGSAITAYNTGNSAAISVNATNGFGVYAQSSNSIPLYGLITNINNTLAAIRANNIGGGVGLHASASNNDGILGISSAANKVGVRGQATGTAGIGVYGTTTSNTGVGISGFNEGGIGVLGTSTSNYGVRGVTSSGTGFAGVMGINNGTTGAGVRGEANFAIGVGVSGFSTAGIGVGGYSETNRAIQGQTNSGTALFGSSTTGYGLEVTGKVKIAGGNTNPSNGAVLTSDASGNAVWKTNRIAFRATGVRTSQSSIGDIQWKRVHYAIEDFDYGNNFNVLTNDAPTGASSVFTAPVSGAYQFNVNGYIRGVFGGDIGHSFLVIQRNRNGVISTLLDLNAYDTYTDAPIDAYDDAFFAGAITVKLNAGDQIYVDIYLQNTTGTITNSIENQFSGHLIFAD